MLEFGTSAPSGNSSNIITQTVKINDIKATYGEKQDWQKYSDDIGLDVTLDIGKDFKPVMYIGGSFKLDEINNTIIGWGRAYKVKMFFDAIGLPIKLAKGTSVVENRLPEGFENHIIGKDFERLSYLSTKTKPDGTNRWRDWQDVIRTGEGKKLKEQFTEAVNNGYVKDFLAPGQESTVSPTVNDNFDPGMPL